MGDLQVHMQLQQVQYKMQRTLNTRAKMCSHVMKLLSASRVSPLIPTRRSHLTMHRTIRLAD